MEGTHASSGTGSSQLVLALIVKLPRLEDAGIVTSIEKLGVTKREPNNILHQMAIKDPMKTLEQAVNNNTKCNIYGVPPSLMMGMTSKTLGTAYNKLIVDTEFVKNNTETLESIIEDL